jgi:HlyD family secretion protein
MITKKRIGFAVGLSLIAATVAAFSFKSEAGAKAENLKYRVSQVDRGTITQTVTASGTINPVALINVGSQMSGTVAELKADFNDQVKKGQVLLKLDPTIFQAQIGQSAASVASAMASARLARSNFDRNKYLSEKSFVSGMALQQSQHEMEVAEANIAVARAQLARAQADLNNSVIRAPIDGVVVKRAVDIGQTVAASFATPTLFQIAQDLTKMQIDTSVSEADIGALKSGMSARFIVDAYPDKEFTARMREFRLAPNVVQNVVSYNVVLDVENKELLLKPGMSSQVRLIVGDRADALRIPTAALRFRLSDKEAEKEAREKSEGAAKRVAATPVLPVTSGADDVAFRNKSELTRLFKIYKVGANNQAVPVDIRIGMSNFRYTEVLAGDLKVSDRVITRALTGGDAE